MQGSTPAEKAWTLHETFLEILRRLNQAEEDAPEVVGLEYPELERTLSQHWTTRSGGIELDRALDLLVENGLVGTSKTPTYSWIRNRTVGERFIVTPLGKSYLLRSIVDAGRIR